MGKSRNRGRSEIESLKGQIRQLKAELKYYRRREHIFEETNDEIEEVQEVKVNQCKSCRRGIVIEYDFVHGVLKKCDSCDFREFHKKK